LLFQELKEREPPDDSDPYAPHPRRGSGARHRAGPVAASRFIHQQRFIESQHAQLEKAIHDAARRAQERRDAELRRLEERKVRALERANDIEEQKARAIEDLRLRR